MTITEFILAVFAVWRVTYMLQVEDGPMAVFTRLQAWIMKRPDKVGGINQGFFCFYCLSVWVSLPITLLIMHNHNWKSFIVYWLAVSTGAILVNKLEQRQ